MTNSQQRAALTRHGQCMSQGSCDCSSHARFSMEGVVGMGLLAHLSTIGLLLAVLLGVLPGGPEGLQHLPEVCHADLARRPLQVVQVLPA